MNALCPQTDSTRLVSALWVGHDLSPDVFAACQREQIGVIFSTRGAELLRHFRPHVVICHMDELDAVTAIVKVSISVIVLGADASEAGTHGVSPVSHDTSATALALVIREAATGRMAPITPAAA